MNTSKIQKITRIFSDETGETHFEEMEVPLQNNGDIGFVSESFQATGIKFRETADNYNYDWHNTPNRQFVIIRKGQVDFTVSTENEKRRFGPGDVILLEDTEGKGHLSQAVDGVRESIFVTLD